jgi:diacylglycerol O-acyltransferase / wax synthase
MSALDYHEMMGSSDALIWTIEKDPVLRSTIASVWFLDEAPTPDRMEATVRKMVTELPRLRQFVKESKPRPVWMDVGAFDLDAHYEYIDAGHAVHDGHVMALIDGWVAQPFDRNQPLWKLGIITGSDDGRTALVLKVHHAIADGVGFVLMLGALTDFEANPQPRAVDLAANVAGSPTIEQLDREHLAELARKARVNPWRAVRNMLRTAVSAFKLVLPTRTPLSSTMTGRSGRLSMALRSMPMNDLKIAGKSVEGSINDAFVAVTLDAVDRYHHFHGEYTSAIRVHMPINIRTEKTKTLAGNQFVPARIAMRLGDPSAKARVRRVRDQLNLIRSEPGLAHINTVSALVQRLGKPAARSIIGGMMKGVDVLASNVPGPPIPMYVAGVKIDEFYAFGPPAGAAVNVTMFTYSGRAYFGISIDNGAVTHQDEFLRCFDEAMADMSELSANPGASHAGVDSPKLTRAS